jgi:hypothetical protein
MPMRYGELPTGARSHRAGWLQVLGLAFAIFSGMCPALASAQEARTTQQMTTLRPSAANRAVRNDLLSVFQPVGEISSGMFVRLHGVSLRTRPYGTQFTGLCRQDTLWLKYAPTDLQPKHRDQPLQPYGVEASAAFHATRVPMARPDDAQMQEDVWSESCDHLSASKDAVWFGAEDAEEAARAVNILKAATDQVRAGLLKAASCDKFPNEKSGCEQIALEEGEIDKINGVSSCPAEAGTECYAIDVGSLTMLTITARPSADELTPRSVESIKVAQYIVVT